MITFTTTATFRPDLIEQTYSSFSKKLTGIKLKDCELIELTIKAKNKLNSICNFIFRNIVDL